MADMGSPETRDASPSVDVCALTVGADLNSQQPVGAALDLPTTPIPPVASNLLPIEGTLVTRVNPVPLTLTGVAAPPEAPPPKSV